MRKCLLVFLLVVFVAVFAVGTLLSFGSLSNTSKVALAQTSTIEAGHIYSITLNDFYTYFAASSMPYFVYSQIYYFSFSSPSELTDMSIGSQNFAGFYRRSGSTSETFSFGYAESGVYPYSYVNFIRPDNSPSNATMRVGYKASSNSSTTETNTTVSTFSVVYLFTEYADFGIPSLNTDSTANSATYFLTQFKARATDLGVAPWLVSHAPEFDTDDLSILTLNYFAVPEIKQSAWDYFSHTESYQIENTHNNGQYLNNVNSIVGVRLLNANDHADNNGEVTVRVKQYLYVTESESTINLSFDIVLYPQYLANGSYDPDSKYYLALCLPPNIQFFEIAYTDEDLNESDNWLTMLTEDYGSTYLFYRRNYYFLYGSNFYNNLGSYSYNQGVAHGAETAGNNQLVNVVWSVLSFPSKILFGTYDTDAHQYVGGLFNFTILGLDIRAFVLSVMSVCLVLACIRVILGSRGGSNG